MPHPKDGYHTADGAKVPSVTTILGQFKDPGGLLQWAFKQGKNPNIKKLYQASEDAMEIGTIAHSLVEDDVHGREIVRPEKVSDENWARALQSFGAYQSWKRRSKLVIVETEVGMVSETHRFGGTLDAIALIGDERARCLPDWKTSNAIHADYLVQIAAYGHLWLETHPDQPLDGGYDLCRFSKEFGDFHHLHLDDLEDAWRTFLHLRAAYDSMEILKRRIK